MSFHRKAFLIQEHTGVKEIKSWVDETYTYGFHKVERVSGTLMWWVATDLQSGARIAKGRTRKECVDWIEQNKDKLDKLRQKDEYKQVVQNFERLKACFQVRV